MKNTFRAIAVLSILCLLIFISSCKKETTTSDDPNIVHVVLNKTIATISGGVPFDSLDLNRDGRSEIIIQFVNNGADTGFVLMQSYFSKN